MAHAEYLSLPRLRQRQSSISVIGSLNGSTPGGWVRYATIDAGLRRDAHGVEHLLPAG